MRINLNHRNMSKKECYENIRKLHKKHPNIVIDADEWLEKHEKFSENHR